MQERTQINACEHINSELVKKGNLLDIMKTEILFSITNIMKAWGLFQENVLKSSISNFLSNCIDFTMKCLNCFTAYYPDHNIFIKKCKACMFIFQIG